MRHGTFQKVRSQGTKVALFSGLAKTVSDEIKKIENVDGVSCVAVRAYRGDPKVKLSWGGGRPFTVIVCDGEYGAQHLFVETKMHGVTARILRRELKKKKISVPKVKCGCKSEEVTTTAAAKPKVQKVTPRVPPEQDPDRCASKPEIAQYRSTRTLTPTAHPGRL